jgi:uncharacterized protein YkwD
MQNCAFLLALTGALVACGGGSGSGASSDPAVVVGGGAPIPPPPAPPTALSSCTVPPEDVKASFLQLVNSARAVNRNCGNTTYGATGALVWNAKLAAAASEHSEDMAKNNFFDHTGSDGSTLVTRANGVGYSYTLIGENIAYAFPLSNSTPDSTMNQWLGSPGHCANIMDPRFVDLAVACAEGSTAAGNAGRRYWTMDLGRP